MKKQPKKAWKNNRFIKFNVIFYIVVAFARLPPPPLSSLISAASHDLNKTIDLGSSECGMPLETRSIVLFKD